MGRSSNDNTKEWERRRKERGGGERRRRRRVNESREGLNEGQRSVSPLSSVSSTSPGFCHNVCQSLSSAIHIIDVIVGFILLGYGIAIVSYDGGYKRQHVFGSLLLFWSCLLLMGGIFGLMGTTSPLCRRFGLTISAYLGPFTALWYFGILIFLFIKKRSFVDWLTIHKKSLHLNTNALNNFRDNEPVWMILILFAALIALARYYVNTKLRDNLLRHDDALRDENERNERRRRFRERRRWDNNNTEDETTTPLLSNNEQEDDVMMEEARSGKIDKETTLDPFHINTNNASTNWWDDPNENEEEESVHFAPIDDEISTGSSHEPWSKEEADTTKDLFQETKKNNNDDGPDLSWVMDD